MIVNDVVTGIIAITIAYLLGSIPAAYIITRLSTGVDIRKLGGGNAGARNVFVEVGKVAGVCVGIFDLGKGAVAVAIAGPLLGAPPYFILGAGLAVVAGHMWSVYLKFTGGNGLAATIGALSVLLTRELFIVFALTIVLWVVTRNLVLSVNLSLISVPISTWFLEQSWQLVVFTILIAIMLVINFMPTARAAVARAGSKEKFVDELLRKDKVKSK